MGILAAVLALVLAVGIQEARTSWLQSRLFSRLASGIGFEMGRGPTDRAAFPEDGPYDVRLGYARLPSLIHRLDSLGFDVTDQARVNDSFLRATRMGAYPIYRAKTSAGLEVLDRSGRDVLQVTYPGRSYQTFESIPDLLWRTLLFIESRGFLDEGAPTRNPAVDWQRFALSLAQLGLRAVGVDRSVAGASTLATQIEKFRHSPDGVTRTPSDKLRQMLTASLRAYRSGPNTLKARRQIVTDFLNSVPLAAQSGYGEVIGTADGVWAWYGENLDEVNRVLLAEPTDSVGRAQKAHVYREVLSLLLAHRRPSYYLATAAGRADLADLTDAYLGLLVRNRVISRWLADQAHLARSSVKPLEKAPARPSPSFVERKAQNLVRSQLLAITGLPGLYDLDHLDLVAYSDLDLSWHEETTRLLRALGDTAFVARNGLRQPSLLDVGDPSKVLYSVTLLERTPDGNAVRVATDNYPGPLSLSVASRLELGSTAKLRTLVTYLEIVEELHRSLSNLPPDSLRARIVWPTDHITRWAVDYLLEHPGATSTDMLAAAMGRRYSASPAERFVTGGGVQTFSNFDSRFDNTVLEVREAFRQSVNLPFVRLMRDLVAYEMARTGTVQAIQAGSDSLRQDYLVRFADREGTQFLSLFFKKYQSLSGPDVFDALVKERHLGSRRLAWAFRTVAPDADEALFRDFIRTNAPDESLSDAALSDLYRRTDPTKQTLSDLGYLARIHPLELWVASWCLHHPGATLADVLDNSRDVRVGVYGWLFRTRSRNAQDQRIRTMLEIEAFQGILARWRRVGYPFTNIVPSIGTAIGSSGDRPLALAELVGIVLSGGLRYPTVRVDQLRFAQGTPFETRLVKRRASPERVLSPAVAATVRDAMVDVVQNGTGQRARGAFTGEDGRPLIVGGKTGTGDNRYHVYSPGGTLVGSRVMNRTATFVFFAGERYFGVVVAYVPGRDAGDFKYTSALPAQVLRLLGPRFKGLVATPVQGDP
jgi:membrane peptidoglycan carboxypeptidase